MQLRPHNPRPGLGEAKADSIIDSTCAASSRPGANLLMFFTTDAAECRRSMRASLPGPNGTAASARFVLLQLPPGVMHSATADGPGAAKDAALRPASLAN